MNLNLLPLIPKDQNEKLWGSDSKIFRPLEYKTQANLMELERFGLSPSPEQWKPTITQLPSLGGLGGPLKALEAKLRDRWSTELEALDSFLMAPTDTPTPENFYPGWTRYTKKYGTWEAEQVPYPLEAFLLYDTETFVRGGGHPVMATAASPEAWYLWIHPELISSPDLLTPTPIPLVPKVRGIIAHNAMFDASKTAEFYSPNNAQRPVAVCTMALHTTISGMGGSQVALAYKALRAKGAGIKWTTKCCEDSLASVLNFYTGKSVSKETRDLFVKGSWDELVASLPALVDYAFQDTHSLWWLWLSLYPKFKTHCPSPITLCGLMELSKSQLPLSKDYRDKIRDNELQFQATKGSLEAKIAKVVKELEAKFAEGSLPPNDPWLSQLDWSPAKTGKNKGKPLWIRKAKEITIGKSFVPLILRVTYMGHPLVLDPKLKWGYRDAEGKFHKLPHPKGPKENVGSPFVKDFKDLWEAGTLSSDMPELPSTLVSLSYWEAYRSRFKDEYIWESEDKDACVPVTKLLGTLTGRQVHKLWLTAAQAKKGKLGTDMTHAIQSREGRTFVSWDEDTEEVRIAAIFGDYFNMGGLGSTPMSQYAIMGSKAKGTDAHSLTAAIAHISRPKAKVANFRDVFGGGRKTQTQALQAAHPEWSQARIDATVDRIMLAKRGTKTGGRYSGGTDSQYHNMANNIANTPDYRLPMTGRQIPDAVNCGYAGRDFFTTRYNFPVQGTGADILHATAAIVGLVAEEKGIQNYGYVMARHDETCYEVEDSRAEEFAEIGNTAHCWAWACFLDSLGFHWMPQPLTRLSAINLDRVYRKEVSAPTDAGFNCSWEFPDGREVN